MKNIALRSIIILSAICLAAAALLAVTNLVTEPIIRESEAAEAKAALAEVMPEGGEFTAIDVPETAPATVTAVWQSEVGYVFQLTASGYAPGIRIMCGIGFNGKITGVKTVSSSETPGFGKKCEEAWYQEQYKGADSSLDGVDAISGATKTSNGYKGAIRDAFELFASLTSERGES